jgi:hypothetical protein
MPLPENAAKKNSLYEPKGFRPFDLINPLAVGRRFNQSSSHSPEQRGKAVTVCCT